MKNKIFLAFMVGFLAFYFYTENGSNPNSRGTGNVAQDPKGNTTSIAQSNPPQSGSTRPEENLDEKILRFRLSQAPATFDWNRAHTNFETYVLLNLMEGLVEFDEQLKVRPALAENWAYSEDKKTITFNLRKGVRWSDGVELKAEHFVNGWKRLLKPLTAASYAYLMFDVVGAESFSKGKKEFNEVGIKATGPYNLVVTLTKPVAHWIYIPTFWATFPIREDLIDSYPATWTKPGRLVSLGPFVLDQYDVGSKVVLRKNPTYYRERGNITKVVAKVIENDKVALREFDDGKLDVLIDLSTILYNRSDVIRFPYMKTAYLGFSTKTVPVNEAAIRRGFSKAIDRSKLPGIKSRGRVPTMNFLPVAPTVKMRNAAIGQFNAFEARRILRRGGWDLTRPLKVSLLVPKLSRDLKVAEFVKSELEKNLGASVEIEPFEYQTFRAQLGLGRFALFLGHWGADFPDIDNFLSVFMSNSSNNHTGWKNSEFDRLVLEARYDWNQENRLKAHMEAHKILLEKEAVIVPLYQEPNETLVKPGVKGFMLNPLNYVYLRKVSLE